MRRHGCGRRARHGATELQRQGIAPPGDPALLFNLIRVSAGGLLALSNELKGTSNIDLTKQSTVDALADMIIAVFLPNEAPSNWKEMLADPEVSPA